MLSQKDQKQADILMGYMFKKTTKVGRTEKTLNKIIKKGLMACRIVKNEWISRTYKV